LEIFAADGEAAIAAALDPDVDCEALGLFASGGTVNLRRMDVWRLRI